MENIDSTSKTYKLGFTGKGGDYFGIVIVNWILTIITLGLYYPWAKAKKLSYLYSTTSLNGDKFTFHGTGKEMFKGFIKAIGIIVLIYILLLSSLYLGFQVIGIIVFYLALIAIIPLAIHGSYRYRMSRTSWRGIRFGYRGDRNELIKNFFKWIFLTLITVGIYGAWLTINLRNYVVSNIRFGSIEVKYEGDGFSYFSLNFKGYLLTIFTLGIYGFWWQKDLFNYYIDNLTFHHEGKKIEVRSIATGGGFFKLIVVNLLIVIFTLGLGYAWVVVRTMDFVLKNIELSGDIDLDSIAQTEENYRDATGEDMSDFLDLGFVL